MKKMGCFIGMLLLLVGCSSVNQEYLIGGTWEPEDNPEFIQQEQACLPVENGIEFIDEKNAITPSDDGRFHYEVRKDGQGEYSLVLLDVVIVRIDIFPIEKVSKDAFGVMDSNNTD